MRVDRRVLAVAGLTVLSVAGLVLEARPPAWIRLDPLLQPFGQGIPPEADGAGENNDRDRSPVPVTLSAATRPELEALPGIGPRTAERIIAWRDTAGTVDDLERLREVRGIGPAKLEALRPWIHLGALPDSMRTDPPDTSS